MESIDFTGLAARAVAGLHEVRACLLASRDGLTLAALPEGGEDLARRALDRLETVGRPERGFLVIGDEVWVVSRRGPYLGIVVAAATAKAGLLLDRLESTLRAAEEAKLLAGSAGPGRPEIPRRPRTPLHRDRSEMKQPNPLFEEVARVVSVPEETHRSESSVGEASATTAWPRTFREPEPPTVGGPGSGSEPPTIVRPTPHEPEEPKVATPEPEPAKPEEPTVAAPEPEAEEAKVFTSERDPEEPKPESKVEAPEAEEEPKEEAPVSEEEPELASSADAPGPEIAAPAEDEREVDTAESGPVQGFLRRYVLPRSQEPSASAVTPTEEHQAIEPEITAAPPEAEEPGSSIFEPRVDEPAADRPESHVLEPAASVSEPHLEAQPDEPEKDDESVHEPEPASMSVETPIPETRAPTFQEQLEALELSRPSPETAPEPTMVKPQDASESDTRSTEDPASLPRLAQPHVDVPKATPHYSPPDALLGEMGRVVAGEPPPTDIRPPGVSPVDMSGTTVSEIEKPAEDSADAKSKEGSKERGEETEVDPVALAREFSQLFDEPERNS